MTDRHEQLFEHKSSPEVDKILALCNFESKGEYFEHESEIITECIQYLSEGRSETQCAYLLRESQKKSELTVNEGILTSSELYQLLVEDLTEEEVSRILEIAELDQKEEYSFAEADSFREGWSLVQEEKEASIAKEKSSSPSPSAELGNDKAEVILNLINSLSEEETEKVVAQLSRRTVKYSRQINQIYDRRFVAQLKQRVESGELSARIQREAELSEGKEFDLIAQVEEIEAQEAQQLKSAGENLALPGS